MTYAGTISSVSLIFLSASLLAGCGGGETTAYQPPLEGSIMWTDGAPPQELEGATVEFESNGKTVAQAGLRPDGTFLLTDALPAGTYRVRVVAPPASYGKPAALDSKYESFEKSTLSYTASGSGPQQVNFKLARRRR